MKPYVVGIRPEGEGWIKLNTNENPYPIQLEMKGEEFENLNLYPDPDSAELCKAIAEKFNVSPQNVFYGNGSDEVLALAFQAFFADQEVCMPDISYGFYPIWAQMYGVRSKFIPLKDWQIDWSEYSGNCIIANPNAPTGLAIEISDVPTDGITIIDEAYIDFASVPSAIELTKKYDNLLVVRTLSKSYSLAGLRFGFAIGNEKLIQKLKLYKDCFSPYLLSNITQKIATRAIKQPPNIGEIIKTREWLKRKIDCLDSQANFLWWHIANAKKMYDYLIQNKILVRYYDNFPDRLRVTIGTQKEMEVFMKCIQRFRK